MVTGVTKRVVVVRCPDTKYFDQAIFMVRDDTMEGRDPERVLEEACRVADSYIRENVEKKRLSRGAILGIALCAVALAVLGFLLFL